MAVLIHLARGLVLRCPHCGEGRLYQSLFGVHPECVACSRPFLRDRGDWTGGVEMAITFGVFITMALFAVLSETTAWPFRWLLAFALGFPILFYPLFYRHVKGFWIGLVRVWEGANPQPNPLKEPEWFTAFWDKER